MKNLVLGLTLLFLVIPCKAETIIVDANGSADFNNIQDAIDYSWDRDIIVVKRGTYTENINFYGKAITVTSTDPNDPNVVDNTLILANHSQAVRFDSGEGRNSVLRGFTIENQGGKIIHCYYSSPTVCKNVISGSSYGIYGEYAFPFISDNLIMGGVYDCDGEIVSCCITGPDHYGIERCDGVIANCIISDKTYAGLYLCHGHIVNSTIINISQDGMRRCNGEIKNCIIVFNGCYGLWECRGTIKYNNVWGNLKGSYSQGTVPSPTDIHLNPHFVNFEKGDYHLKSKAGRWDPNSQTWVIDDVNSPCIDAGDPNDSIGYEPNPNGGRINMGAYGGTAEASKSPSGIIEPVCTEYPVMDFNKDCKVDFEDFALFAKSWLDCNIEPPSACWE